MNTEILQIIEAVAREKSLTKEQIICVIEEAVAAAAKRKYGQEQSIDAKMDRKTGDMKLFRESYVVSDSEEEIPEEISERHKGIAKMLLEFAVIKDPAIEVGQILLEPLPPLDLGRITAQAAKQVITSRVKEVERQVQYEEFKDKIGEIMSGIVQEVSPYNTIVKFGSAEGVLRKESLLHADKVKVGDRIRAYLVDIDVHARGPQLLLSRTHPGFLMKLFAQEVPEVYSNVIEIRGVARDPGFRAKIAVYTSDASIDPVGSCVGIRGSRVQAVITELCGEKIDIIPWSPDPASFVISAIAPAEVLKIIIDEDRHRIEVVVPDDQLSIAIGKGGQNVKLASEIVGWQLDITAETDESKKRAEEFTSVTNKFMVALDLEEILAQLLASEGYAKVSDIADAKQQDLASIQGLDEGIADELINRARSYLDANPEVIVNRPTRTQRASKSVEREEMTTPESSVSVLGIRDEALEEFHKAGVNTLQDLADLSYDDFMEELPNLDFSRGKVERLIMDARQVVYFDKE